MDIFIVESYVFYSLLENKINIVLLLDLPIWECDRLSICPGVFSGLFRGVLHKGFAYFLLNMVADSF